MPRWPNPPMTEEQKKQKKREYDQARKAERKAEKPVVSKVSRDLPIGVAEEFKIKSPEHGLKIAVLPDAQLMPGVPMDHLVAFGKYCVAKRPDVIVCLGDFGDFPSLSRFNTPRSWEGLRYQADVSAFHRGMENVLNPIAKAKGYNPVKVFCDGNHEDHIRRAVHDYPWLEGVISHEDLLLDDYGWDVYPFLQPVEIGGVSFCHYYPSGPKGLAIGSATALLRKLHMSAIAGHLQGRDIAYSRRADGRHMTAIISGSFYQHTYQYMSPFQNAHWRGFYMLHEVKDGQFDEMMVSINFLQRRFG